MDDRWPNHRINIHDLPPPPPLGFFTSKPLSLDSLPPIILLPSTIPPHAYPLPPSPSSSPLTTPIISQDANETGITDDEYDPDYFPFDTPSQATTINLLGEGTTVTITDDEIVTACQDALDSAYFNKYQSALRLPGLPLVVKFGIPGELEAEFENQRYAATRLDPRIVRVPRVHRYFRRGRRDYILMDYIDGVAKTAYQLEESHYAKLQEILTHFQTITRDRPGPFEVNGTSYRCPFTDTGVELNGDVETLENWTNKVLWKTGHVSFRTARFIFCHRDFAPRNTIWAPNGDVYLLDWLTAGFYPLSFELCAQRNASTKEGDYMFIDRIEKYLESSATQSDLDEAIMMERAWGMASRFH